MLTEKKGIEAIIALQAEVGVVEPEERARKHWRTFTTYEKENTEAAHRAVCGGFPKEEIL